MVLVRKISGGVLGATLLATGLAVASVPTAQAATTPAAVSSAPSIGRVTCGNRTDWLIFYSDATTCWANAGSADVRLYNVTGVNTGNNAGTYNTDTQCVFFTKWQRYSIPKTTVSYISIS